MDVLVVGDAVLDVTVAPSGPTRIGGDAPAAISVAPGGQGANVAVRLARRGLSVMLVAPLADDEQGGLMRAALARENVELLALASPRSGAVVVLLAPDGERTMLSDRAPLPAGGVEEIEAAVARARWLHCSGYALRDPQGYVLAGALARRGASQRLCVGGGSPATDDAGRFAAALVQARPDLLIVSRDEAAALASGAGPGTGDSAVELGRLFGCVVVVTGGVDGAEAAGDDGAVGVPAATGDGAILDTTGAGDAFAAALLAALLAAPHDEPWPPSRATMATALAAGARAGREAIGVRGAQAPIPDEADRDPAAPR